MIAIVGAGVAGLSAGEALRDLGYEASDTELSEVYRRVTALADQAKLVRPRDIVAIAHEVIRRRPAPMAAESTSAA